MKCFECHKEWHFKKDRPKRKYKNKDEKEKSGDAIVASEAQDYDGYNSSGVLISTNSKYEGNRVINSCCSFHMCSDKSLFVNYQTYDSGIVMMENNACCRVIGKGLIRLKMSNGMIRELHDVKHVLKLKRSMISLGILYKLGYLFKLESGTLKVLERQW